MKRILFIGGILYGSFCPAQNLEDKLNITVTSFTDTLVGGVGEIERDIMGNLFVADFGEKVWKINRFGTVSVFSDKMYGASGNTLDAQGNLYQAQYYGNTILKINRYTNEITEVAHKGLKGPVGLVFNNNKLHICNCNGNFIAQLDSNNQVTTIAKGDLFNCPNGIAVGPQGNLYVVNYRNANVVKIDKDNKVSLFAKLPATSGGHIIFSQGNFYATSFFDHKIFKLSMDGKVTHIAGSGKLGIANGAGIETEFSFPNGIVAGKGELYVNDKITDPNGGPLRTVIRKITFPNLTKLLTQALNSEGIPAARKLYKNYKENPLFANDKTQALINKLGYSFINSKQLDFAVVIFILNTESYPDSFNVWDSLAEAYLLKEDKENAKKYYLKSLELNPKNKNATDILKTL